MKACGGSLRNHQGRPSASAACADWRRHKSNRSCGRALALEPYPVLSANSRAGKLSARSSISAGAVAQVSDEAAVGRMEGLDTSLPAGLRALLPARKYAVDGCHSYCFVQSYCSCRPRNLLSETKWRKREDDAGFRSRRSRSPPRCAAGCRSRTYALVRATAGRPRLG